VDTKNCILLPAVKIKRMKPFSEDDILEKLQDPHTRREAFTKVVEAYSEKLYWLIRKMVLSHDDANDILQNTFLKAWTNLDHFRGEAKLLTWMHKIAVNESVTFLNRQRAMHNISLDDTDVYMLERLSDDEYFDGDALQLKLEEAILTLPEKQRIVFLMKYKDEMKYEDMSEILGTSVGALKASYHHAVKKIETFLIQDI
jgi:RNA polymerase sigma-70 factor (ECF subfamily)